MKFTIIIPLYNCAKYINKALSSIINNNYDMTKIQIIVVDDGSSDNYQEKISQFMDKIELYKKENGNWGSVVNYVKNNVLIKGDYVTILDADDYLSNNFFKTIASSPKADIIMSNFYALKNNRKKKMNIIWGTTRVIKNINKCRSPYSQPICKLYKRDLFLKLPNIKENKSFLDSYVFHYLLSSSKSVYYINKCLGYWYSDRENNSTSSAWTLEKTKQFVEHFQNMIDLGSIEAVLLTCISSTIRNNIRKQKFYLKQKGKYKYEWLPKIFVPLVLLIIFVLRIKKNLFSED